MARSWKRKEWLIAEQKAGRVGGTPVKAGRGRLALEFNPVLIQAKADGVVFSDWPGGAVTETVKPPSKSKSGIAEKVVRIARDATTSATEAQYLTPDEYRFPEAEYKAVDGAGKTHGMREACNLCRVSLVNHFCDNPTILGDISVKIVKR